MRKIFIGIIGILVFVCTSCGTINIRNHSYGDAKVLDADHVTTLVYDETIDVKKVNGNDVNWDMTIGDLGDKITFYINPII
jgi:hypothetical protein